MRTFGHTLAALSCAIWLTTGGAVLAADKDVVVFRQRSRAFGRCELYLSADAARFYGRNGDVIIMTKAPSWKTLIFSKSKNAACEFEKMEGDHTKLGVFTSPLPTATDRLRKFWDKELNVEAGKVITAGSATAISHDVFIFQNRSKRRLLNTSMEVYQAVPLNPKLQRFVGWVYSFNAYGGVPLDLTVNYGDGSAENMYHTTAIEHVRKSESFFDYVTKYKKVPTVLKVLVSEDINTTLEDLLGDTPARK